MKKKIIRLVLISYTINIVALAILMLKVFYPYYRSVAFCIYGISWAIFIYVLVITLSKKYYEHKRTLLSYLPVFFIFLGSLLTLWVILNLFPVNSLKIFQADKVLLQEKMRSDQIYTENYIQKIEETKNKFVEQIKSNSLDSLTPEQKLKTKEFWRDYLSYFIALEEVVDQYRYFYQINYLTDRLLNEQGFMLAYSAFLANYSSSLDLIKEVQSTPLTKTLLNEQDLSYSIPQNAYLEIEKKLLKPENIMQATAGYVFLKTIKRDGLSLLKKESDKNYKNIIIKTGKNPDINLRAAIDYFEKTMFVGWFPVQKEVSKMMGDTKIPLGKKVMVDEEKIKQMEGNIFPGDVFLQRRNWYLSNAGLPGFWKHTVIYIGNLSEIDLFFDEIIAKTNLTKGLKVSEYIKSNFPDLYEEIKDNKKRTLEAESEGVVSFTLEKSMSADYVAVIRPKISKEEKLKALIYAFNQFGKPYDFDFDFLTDNSIVCSELFYKAYSYVNYKLRMVSGRLVLSSNHIVQDFDENYQEQKELFDFIYFIDADEKSGKSFFSDLSGFRNSWQRNESDVIKTLLPSQLF